MGIGKTSSGETQIPAWAEDASIEALNRSRDIGKTGYMPYYGPEVAAFTPAQMQGFGATEQAAQAFGLGGDPGFMTAGIPEAETFDGGITGYGSIGLYDETLDKFREARPGQAAHVEKFFIDPYSGEYTGPSYAPTVEQVLNTGYAAAGDTDAVMSGLRNASDGGYFGVNQQYNPYTMQAATEDITGDGVVDYRDASFGEAGRRQVGTAERLVDFLNPFGLVGKALDYGEGLVDGFTPYPSEGLLAQHSGAMEPTEAQQIMQAAADRYEQSLAQTIPDSTLTSPEVLLAQAYDNTPAVTPYVDTQGDAGVMTQPVVYTPPATTPSDYGYRDWTPPTTVTTPVTTPTIVEVVPGTDYTYNSGGRVGFGFGL